MSSASVLALSSASTLALSGAVFHVKRAAGHLLPSAVALHVVDDLADRMVSPPHDLLVGAHVDHGDQLAARRQQVARVQIGVHPHVPAGEVGNLSRCRPYLLDKRPDRRRLVDIPSSRSDAAR